MNYVILKPNSNETAMHEQTLKKKKVWKSGERGEKSTFSTKIHDSSPMFIIITTIQSSSDI